MNSIFNFNTLITPKIITIIYWLCLFAVLITSIVLMFSGHGGASFFGGLFFLIFGAISVRVYCEVIMVFFKNNQYLKEISLKDKV
ncbi:DUF4282 domain-containing protein [Psychrobacter sp.]|uniref:DUF4282 domain-containing protein n=1 Tax=Psychrobacter sp. TaxID=56811 RepID=UPI0025E010BF|nr:DUF4282 domain-containing protein [Psychrobacter sp.]